MGFGISKIMMKVIEVGINILISLVFVVTFILFWCSFNLF